MVPEGWRKRSLEDVARIQTGIAKGKKNISDPVLKPYLRVANVQDGFLDLAEIKEIEVAAKDVERYSLQDLDVVLTEGGDFDKLGRGTLWESQIPVCLHQNHVFVVRVDRDVLLPAFFSAQTNSAYGKAYFLSCAKRSTNLASINSTQLKQFPTLVPPLPEQKKIAEILSTWDRAIEVSEALLATARKQKRALMQSLLTGKRRFPEFEGQEWKEVRLGDVAEVEWGNTSITKSSYVNNGYPAYSAAGQDGFVSIGEKTGQGIVLSAIGARCGRCFWANGQWTAIKNTIVVQSGGEAANLRFLFQTANDPRFWPISGGAQPFIGLKNARAIKLKLPSEQEQSKIANVLGVADHETADLEAQIEKLRTEKKALMQQLLTGKRRVAV